MPASVYVHPWEIDPAQPRLGGPFRSKIRHYTRLKDTERRLETLLRTFRFAPMGQVLESQDENGRIGGGPGGGNFTDTIPPAPTCIFEDIRQWDCPAPNLALNGYFVKFQSITAAWAATGRQHITGTGNVVIPKEQLYSG